MADYKRHVELNQNSYKYMRDFENTLSKSTEKEFIVKGVSYPANQYVNFKVDRLYSDGININWRERLICPVTGLNNRLRASIQIMDFELGMYESSIVYITEQVTPLFSFLMKRFSNLMGSEFLDTNLSSGTIRNNIRHEDMTRLSFASESIEYYLSFECFEHIPFFKKAIEEIYRVLKPGGFFLGTFPFDINAESNFIKATLDEKGRIIYHTEPEYHGDPVNGEGILCYTIFGWEMLDDFRKQGFKDVYLVLLWSDVFGYLGGEQIFFIARK